MSLYNIKRVGFTNCYRLHWLFVALPVFYIKFSEMNGVVVNCCFFYFVIFLKWLVVLGARVRVGVGQLLSKMGFFRSVTAIEKV